MAIEWEEISDSNDSILVRRAKIPGGWLVFAYSYTLEATGLTFVPDPNHEWDGKSS
jgi:hypothetical protein